VARIRTIKPEILEDEKTAALSDAAFRLFTSMIFLADDHGNVRADPRWLLGQIWWARRESPRVAEILREVSEAGLVEVYEVRGGVYAHLRGWGKHQRIDNAGKPRVPLPNDADAQPFPEFLAEGTGVSRRFAEIRGEIPLDPDPDPEHRSTEGDQDREVAAAWPALAALKSKVRKSGRVPSSSPLPSDWEPRPEERATAASAGLDWLREAEAFRDHHAAKGSRFTDWHAAFRTWLRNAVKFSKPVPRQGSLSVGRVEPSAAEAYPDGEVTL
jgi:hypothetical protein